MPPTSFDFDRAVDALKSESPTRIPTARTILSPRGRQPRLTAMRVVAVTGAVCLGLGLLWPRESAPIAWAQVRESVQAQSRVHIVLKIRGVSTWERWVDGSRYAFVMRGYKGEDMFVVRCDGKYAVRYANLGPNLNGLPKTAWRSTVRPGEKMEYLGAMGGYSNIVDDLIKEHNLTVTGQKIVTTGRGKFIRYQVKSPNYGNPSYVYADPETKLVSKVEQLGKNGAVASLTEVDYPDHIDDKVFSTDLPGVEIRDLDLERTQVSADLKNGFGKRTVAGQEIELRSVLYERSGGLWVLWTGSPPTGDLRYPIRVAGFPEPKRYSYTYVPKMDIINFFSIKAFTRSAGKDGRPVHSAPSVGKKLSGMAIGLKNQKFQTVTVFIPVLDASGNKKLGEAKFEDVPVRRINSIYDYGDLLGLHRQ